MNQLSATQIVRAPIAKVWETLADVGSIADWHPGVANSPVLTEHRSGMGAARRVELYDGSTVVETVSALEEGRSVTVTMSDHSMPLSMGEATFSIEADGEDRTRVTMTLAYGMKFGPLGWLLNAVMLQGIMSKLLVSVLAGLDHHLATGELIGEGWAAAA